MSGMLGAVMSGMTGPFVAVIARSTLHASELEMALIATAPVIGNLFSLVWANMMEGRRKMPFAIAAWVISRAMYVFVVFATTSPVFVGIILAMNFVQSIAGPAYSALMKEIYPDGERAKIMGYARVCTWSVLVIATLAGGWLLKLRPDMYRYVFPVAAVFGVISAIVFGKIPTYETTGDSEVSLARFARDSVSILHHDPGFRWFSGATFIYGFANFLVAPAYAMYQVDVLGVDTRWASIYTTLSAIVIVISFFYWGSYIDQRRPEKVLAFQMLVWTLIPLIYMVAREPWMLILTALIGGVVGAGNELSYFNGVLYFAPVHRLTQYQAVFAALMGVRGLIAPVIGAYMIKERMFGFSSSEAGAMRCVFIITALMIIISVLVQLEGARRYKSLKNYEE